MKFKYTGEAPNGSFEMFGATWKTGEVSEVDDAQAEWVEALKTHPMFEGISEETTMKPKPKAKKSAVVEEVEDGEPDKG